VGWPFFFLGKNKTKETIFFLGFFCSFFVSVFLPFFLSLCLTPELSHGHGSTSNGTYVSQKKNGRNAYLLERKHEYARDRPGMENSRFPNHWAAQKVTTWSVRMCN